MVYHGNPPNRNSYYNRPIQDNTLDSQNNTRGRGAFILTRMGPPYPGSSATVQSRPIQRKKRTRTAFTTYHIQQLERTFSKNRYIKPADRRELSKFLRLDDKSVKIWFQNRRMKAKKDIIELCTNNVSDNTFSHSAPETVNPDEITYGNSYPPIETLSSEYGIRIINYTNPHSPTQTIKPDQLSTSNNLHSSTEILKPDQFSTLSYSNSFSPTEVKPDQLNISRYSSLHSPTEIINPHQLSARNISHSPTEMIKTDDLNYTDSYSPIEIIKSENLSPSSYINSHSPTETIKSEESSTNLTESSVSTPLNNLYDFFSETKYQPQCSNYSYTPMQEQFPNINQYWTHDTNVYPTQYYPSYPESQLRNVEGNLQSYNAFDTSCNAPSFYETNSFP